MKQDKYILGIFLAIVFGNFFIFVLPNCGQKITPAEKAIQEASYAAMKVELYQAQIGDFLKFKDGRIGLITNLGGDGFFFTTSVGTPAYDYSAISLSKNVIQIIKQNTPEWEQATIQYCTPPYYQ